MSYMFAYCESLILIPISKWDISNADIYDIFDHCTSLASIPNIKKAQNE